MPAVCNPQPPAAAAAATADVNGRCDPAPALTLYREQSVGRGKPQATQAYLMAVWIDPEYVPQHRCGVAQQPLFQEAVRPMNHRRLVGRINRQRLVKVLRSKLGVA